MQDFISTETVILVTFLCRNMPNLYRYIVQFSTPSKKRSSTKTSTQKLSAKQIREARMHSNTIIQQALNAIATIQSTINTVDNKINKLVKQRSLIENTLLALLSMNT